MMGDHHDRQRHPAVALRFMIFSLRLIDNKKVPYETSHRTVSLRYSDRNDCRSRRGTSAAQAAGRTSDAERRHKQYRHSEQQYVFSSAIGDERCKEQPHHENDAARDDEGPGGASCCSGEAGDEPGRSDHAKDPAHACADIAAIVETFLTPPQASRRRPLTLAKRRSGTKRTHHEGRGR